ncbi:MAG: hypothetical protein AVDCRST_MAG42-320 [uncultured Chthoniobacterales bacterium]|uniref:Type II secretion system protein GspC N-terminal domain-containing protein n=1 Tax=uncultured Chthoniobacterales bacterium TaxID=1836801 RepID=A0A6J4H6G0_9BACT|nr:MAG: hypothetical protein AVDCRST_MAG42-320 [uncultured Chthoniobacterales bacterium]
MKNLIFTIVATSLALHSAQAADATANDAPVSAPPSVEASGEGIPAPAAIEIKNKSAFAIPENGRSPFWPIGWKPTPKQAGATGPATEVAGPEVPPSAFLVSSIVMDPRARFAIINGKVMNEGQVFGLQMGSSTYQITVKAIEDGRVVLVRGRDQEIVAPLRRR